MTALATLTAAIALLVGHPVQVTVNDEDPGSWGGSAPLGMPWLDIGRDALTDAESGGGHGLTVLLHEVAHTTGIENEAEANCWALAHLPGFYESVWGSSWVRRELMRAAYRDGVASMLQQSDKYHCAHFAPPETREQ